LTEVRRQKAEDRRQKLENGKRENGKGSDELELAMGKRHKSERRQESGVLLSSDF
jgi:hypothetical protein